MKSFQLFKKISLWQVFLFSFLVCICFIFTYPIYILDEAKNSEAAREMLMSGNFIVPYFNEVLRTDKPPLHYFFMVLGYKIFGVNAFGARFFSAVFGALTLTGTFYYVKKLFSEELAQLTWFVLVSAFFFVQVFHQSVPDPYLIFFVSMAMYSFLDFYKNRKLSALLIAYVFIGFGTLSKGPVAIALPGLVLFMFLWMKKELFSKKLLNYKPFLAILIVLLVAVPWFYAVHKATNGAWTDGFFFKHNLNRFGSKMEGHGGIFIITWLFVILGLLPFSVYVVQSFIFGFKQRKNDLLLFAYIVSCVFVGFFSISQTKLPNYTMPSYPFIALLIAFFLQEQMQSDKGKKQLKLGLIILLILSILLPIGGFIALSIEEQLKPARWYSLFILIVTVGSGIALRLFNQDKVRKSLLIVGFSWVGLSFFLHGFIYPKLFKENPVSMAQEILPKNAKIIAYKRFDSAFPINFNQTFKVVDSLDEVEQFFKENPEGYVMSNDGSRKDLLQLNTEQVLHQKAVFENHHTLIVKKK